MRKDEHFKAELDQALDYAAVLDRIADHASFSASQTAIRTAMPLDTILAARDQLNLAGEALELVRQGITLSMAGITDISHLAAMARKHHTLLPGELLEVYLFLCAVHNVRHALTECGQPALEELAELLSDEPKLKKALQTALDMTGTLKPDASPRLRSLHQQLTGAQNALSALGRNFVKKNGSALMEHMTTMVAGRLCVLVKAQDKYAFGGMIHGSSQSGQAFYVEPATFVQANNQVQALKQEIEEEKTRICQELTRSVAHSASALDSGLETMTLIDTAFAKGKWAHEIDGTIPTLQSVDHTLRMEHAIHPLLNRDSAVANDYELSRDQSILLLSGPNMGGKTVTLKTIGISVVLALAGFPVPARHAILPWYDRLYFDIGDTQSIENNLSTFSSHMKRIARLCTDADASTFALLDEIGNGTDPLEGASLAIAILSHLQKAGASILTSTHYSDVKTWAGSNPAVLTASMAFDPETLQPLYKYLPGISGSSYAFAIARTCGLPPAVLDSAAQIKEQSASKARKELDRLETLQEQARKKQERFDALIADAHKLQKDAAAEKEKWQKQKARLDTQYKDSLEAMLEEKEAEAQTIIKSLQDKSQYHMQLQEKEKLKSLFPQEEEKPVTHTFAVGDYVRITGLNSHGEIIELKKKEATVLANGIRTRVKLNVLEPMERPVVQKTMKRARVDSVAARIPLELNLIGMRVEEGLRELDHYLDQAIVHHVSQVRIIHGMGTGKLRSAIWKDLAKRSTVKSYTAAGPSDGGLGATIVTLR